MRAAAAALAFVLVGCGLVPGLGDEEQGPAGIEPSDAILQPIGPVVVIGRGVGAVNGPWRYEVFNTEIGTCTHVVFESGEWGETNCPVSLHLDPFPAAITLQSYSSDGQGWRVHGMVSDEVAAAWIELAGGERVIAGPLMPTADVGGLGRVFYVEIPDGGVPVSAVAADDDGEVLDEKPMMDDPSG